MRFPKMSLSSRRWSGALVALICLTWCVAARAADPNSAVGANAAGAASIHGDAVLHYLDQTIDWYHRVVALDQAQVDSQQLLYRDGVRSSAEQILKLAFDFARAEAAILDSHTKQSTTSAASAGTAARLKLAAETAAQRVIDLKAQLSDSYRTAKTTTDAARQSKLAAELDLATAQRDALTQYAGFMNTAASGGGASLSDKIDQLEQTVPELADSTTPDAAKTTASAGTTQQPEQFHPESAGILTLVTKLFSLTTEINDLNRLKDDALNLQKMCDEMRVPIRAQIVQEMHQSNAIAATTQESSDPAHLDADRKNIESLTADFKLTSSAGIPLGEQSALLASASEGLLSWHDSLRAQYALAAQSLLLRTLGTALIVIVLVIISELWRRATFRYISDTRRRRQLMLIRRIVIGLIVLFIIIASVVTEFGSLATFAGLITAGIAVALQTVILSGVAYFFFIGRFGVRVGDRVTVSGITGDVVEIGLFRLYLMELTGPITDLHPTGRMIVFSNSVLFQPSAFYKQLPGTDYSWHQIALTVSPDTDHNVAEKRLMAAVESVFAEYKATIDEQFEESNRILHVQMEVPRPQVRLRFVADGVEMVIRYPVDLQRASQIEDQLTRKLLEAIAAEPKLKMVSGGTPRIQSAA